MGEWLCGHGPSIELRGDLGVKEQGQTDIYQLPRAGRSAMAVGTTRALAFVRLVAECLS